MESLGKQSRTESQGGRWFAAFAIAKRPFYTEASHRRASGRNRSRPRSSGGPPELSAASKTRAVFERERQVNKLSLRR